MSKDPGYSDSKADRQGSRIRELEARLADAEKERDWNKDELERVAELALKYNSRLKKAIEFIEAIPAALENYPHEIAGDVQDILVKLKDSK